MSYEIAWDIAGGLIKLIFLPAIFLVPFKLVTDFLL